jgi:YVTN family beta-propeller protein
MQRWTLAQQDVISRSTSHFARPEFPTPKRREPRSPPSPFLRSTAPTLPTLAAFILSVLFLAPAGAIHVAPPAQQFHPAIATPVLTTSLSALSIPAGGSVYDTASFTGFANGTVSGGTVTYYLYLGSLTCSSSGGPPITVSTVTVSPLGAIPNSASQTFNSVGPDGWQAAYSGNVNNNPVQSPCEPMNVTVANTTIVTNLSASSITAGSSVHDSATLSGETPSASGTVTYVFYNNLNCTGNATTVSIVTVTAGHVPNSAPHTFNMVGGYGWRAIYSGDANNTGATSSCELLNVSLALPTITTTLSNNTVPAGGAVFDTATLSGATPNAGGTVTYVLFADGNCTGNYTVVSVVTVTGALVPNSASHTFPSAGKYSWEAIYSGDANNSGATSSCEFLNVTSTVRNPTITTTLHNSVIPVAGSVYDSAALTGAAPNAGGTVTYVLFSDGNCTGNSTVVSVVTVTGALVPNSASHFFGNVGSYSWEAIYSGDANDSGATSSCEVLTVTPRVSSITTTLSASSVLEGGSVHDSAALTGVTLNAGGTVTYYWSGTCPPSASHTVGTVTVTSAIVPNSPSVTLNFGIGYFYFYAVYSGDGNNAGAQSPCEQLLVTKANPQLTTTLSASKIPAGGSVHDTATLTGSTPSAGGTVTYYFFSNNQCGSAPATLVGTVTVTNAIVPPSPPHTFASTGQYNWYAVYSGDAGNNGTTSPCEHLNVTLASPRVVTTLGVQNPLVATRSLSSSYSCGDVYDPANDYVYAALPLIDEVGVYAPTSLLAIVNTLHVGTGPCAIAYDPVNGYVYVANQGSNSVSVIAGLSVIGTVPVGSFPYGGVGVDTVNGHVFVSNFNGGYGNTVSVISGLSVIATVSVGTGPDGMAFDPANGDMYVANSNSGTISVISGSTNTVVHTITIGSWADWVDAVAMDTANGDIYVAKQWDNSISVISGVTNTVIHTISVGLWPNSITYDPLNQNLYVPLTGNAVDVVSGISNTPVGSIPSYSFWGAYDSQDNYLVLTSSSPFSISEYYLGYQVNDTALLIGASSNPTGTVTYRFFVGNSCSGTPTTVSTVSITSALAPVSAAHRFPTEYYSWDAVYGGDANNNPATSPCEVWSPSPIGPPIPFPWQHIVSFAMFCPVNPLVTDPNGHEEGFQTNGSAVNGLPGSTLMGPNTEPTGMALPNATWGVYHLTLFGTNSASSGGSNFDLLVEAASANGTEVVNATYHGVTYPGASQTFVINVSATGVTISAGPVPKGRGGNSGYSSVELWAGGLGGLAVVAVLLAVMWRGRSRRSRDTGVGSSEKEASPSGKKVEATDQDHGKGDESGGGNEVPGPVPSSPKVNDPLRGVLAPSPNPTATR